MFEVIDDMHCGPTPLKRNVGSYHTSDSSRENFLRDCPLFRFGLVNPPMIDANTGDLVSDLTFKGLRALDCLGRGFCFNILGDRPDIGATRAFYQQWWDERDYGIETNVFDRLGRTGNTFMPDLKREYMLFKLSAEPVRDRMFVMP